MSEYQRYMFDYVADVNKYFNTSVRVLPNLANHKIS